MARSPTQQRSLYWCTIVYPDSAVWDWKKRLDNLHMKAVVSPLHHPDPDPDTPVELKEHHHVMLMFDSLKSRGQVLEICTATFGDGYTRYLVIPESKSGMLRYFCHLQNPGKERLDPKDVLCFGGVDYLEEIADDGQSLYITLMDMTRWIHSNHCCSFVKFMLYCECNNLEWARIASTRASLYVKAIIDSERSFDKDTLEEKKNTATTTAV